MCLTLFLIIAPSLLLLIIVVFLNDGFCIELKVFLAIIYVVSLSICLFSLFYVSMTEPGIIPSLAMHQVLPRGDRKHEPDNKKGYYVLYRREDDLEEVMKEKGYGQNDYVGKFYDRKKYRY